MNGSWFRARAAQLDRPCRILLAVAALGVGVGACGSSGKKAVPPTKPTVTVTTLPASTTTATPTTATTLPTAQASGARTVLSPIGLNVRAQPAKSAKVLGTAAQGTVLTVLANNGQGWLEVKGATTTGWISATPALSAPGKFGALYPLGWTAAEAPPTNVVFRAPSGPDTVVVTNGASVAALGRGRAGYHQSQSEQIVVCGVTTHLDTYMATGVPAGATTAGATVQQYLAQVLVPLDAQHALGINANLTDLSVLPTVRNFANSVTFPYPECQR
jgi:hypothetical protein